MQNRSSLQDMNTWSCVSEGRRIVYTLGITIRHIERHCILNRAFHYFNSTGFNEGVVIFPTRRNQTPRITTQKFSMAPSTHIVAQGISKGGGYGSRAVGHGCA